MIILILGALSTVSPFSIDMYLPTFPQIAHDLGTTPAQISLSVSGYFIGRILGREIVHIRINLLVDHFTFEENTHLHTAQFQGIGDGKFLSANAHGLMDFVQ